MHKELAQLGITQDLANSLISKIPAEPGFFGRSPLRARDYRAHHADHRRSLAGAGRPSSPSPGPAGAGKTTLLAKLAARWVLRHGPRRVALVSADAVRIGAHEQMHMLGRLLGVTTHNVYDVAELPELLYELRGCQFVMIDTAGASPRDPELARRLRLLNQMQASIETALVLPASTQAGAIDEVVQRFALAQADGLRHHQGGRGGEPRRHFVGAGAPQAARGLRQRRATCARRSATRAFARAGEPRGGNRQPQRLERRR